MILSKIQANTFYWNAIFIKCVIFIKEQKICFFACKGYTWSMKYFEAIFNRISIMAHYLIITKATRLPVPICMSTKIINSYSSILSMNKMSVNIAQLFLKLLYIRTLSVKFLQWLHKHSRLSVLYLALSTQYCVANCFGMLMIFYKGL